MGVALAHRDTQVWRLGPIHTRLQVMVFSHRCPDNDRSVSFANLLTLLHAHLGKFCGKPKERKTAVYGYDPL